MAKDNSGSIMVAFVIGALTGAAVALLFAPASGDETRDYLGQKAREGKDRLKEQRDHVLTAVERGREAFNREHGEHV
jgi:gas vesicle protein